MAGGKKPMSDEEYKEVLKGLPPLALKRHKNFVALMEAADRGDKKEMAALITRFRAESAKLPKV